MKQNPKDILPKDKNGRYYGLCKMHCRNGQLDFKGVYFNRGWYGYCQKYVDDGSADEYYTGYYMNGCLITKDNKQGYCYIWNTKEVEQL
jgi:antitoxin component YwqK of YwqJK toxin-antitoxin module